MELADVKSEKCESGESDVVFVRLDLRVSLQLLCTTLDLFDGLELAGG